MTTVFNKSATNDFPVGKGCWAELNVKYVFAQKKQRGKHIPANVPVQVQYTNLSGNAKTFSYNMEYMY